MNRQCTNCSAENASSRRFCRLCGVALLRSCARCEFDNAATDLFCGGCGRSLVEETPDPEDESDVALGTSIHAVFADELERVLIAQQEIQAEEDLSTDPSMDVFEAPGDADASPGKDTESWGFDFPFTEEHVAQALRQREEGVRHADIL